MKTFQESFERIFVINLERRKDRWKECRDEFWTAGIPMSDVTRWPAYEGGSSPESNGTHTHRDILRHIKENKIRRALILEDDFQAITTQMLKDAGHTPGRKVLDTHCSILNGEGTFVQRFEAMEPFIPAYYDFLWLGGGYGEKPRERVNRHIIRCGRMKGTHAYGVSLDGAKIWTDWIDKKTLGNPDNNCGASDDIITSAALELLFYCLQPRLLTQRPGMSDLTRTMVSYLDSFTNPDHEAMLPGGPV